MWLQFTRHGFSARGDAYFHRENLAEKRNISDHVHLLTKNIEVIFYIYLYIYIYIYIYTLKININFLSDVVINYHTSKR